MVDGAVRGKFPGHSVMVALSPELCVQRQPGPTVGGPLMAKNP